MKTLLLIEDNLDIRDLLREYLSEHGYAVRVASNGRQGLQEARHAAPDLVLLDLMMPEMDGLDFLRAFRADFQTPVIVLTARDAELDKVLGLELGADDYVTKPFSMAELLARVRAQLRRGSAEPASQVQRAGPLELDAQARTVRVRGERAELTRTEFDLLQVLVRAPGRVFTRLELLEAVQEDALGSERTIDVHIRNLRAKLEEEPASPQLILTVFGVGYRLQGD
ncbi:DNA-binding response regulator [Deinococcus piscis]|uniref:DNA-binding response regulator n=1 Tax=Deinococcus piscis TaxID=394230 RepID=A0ABQ3JXU7_9DEIO|nr:response regulator transcription factor [Deinococcus piscis]GHF93710.1 DNA-binding response regulator [Deinococcus piscis]